MKWLSILFVLVVGTTVGVMQTGGMLQHVFQFAFFGTLALCFVLLATGALDNR